MIDSVGIFLPDALASVDRLESIRPIRGDGCFRGMLGPLRVTQGTGGVFIRGSLPSFLMGGNALPLTRVTLRDALGKLETELRLPLAAGKVYELELAKTLPVKSAPRDYLAAWATLPRFTKATHGNGETVSFIQRARSFSGYDKGAELAPEALPVPLEGLRGLRLEYKMKKGLKRFYGHPVAPWDLAEAGTYDQAVKAWANQYFRILKRREVVLNMEGMTPSKLTRTFAALGLAALGLERAEEIIRDGLASGALGKMAASRMRAEIRELGQDARLTDTAPLTDEVDGKVRAVARFAR